VLIYIAASEVIERVELSETPVSVCGIIELISSISVHIHYQLKNDTKIVLIIMMQNAHKTSCTCRTSHSQEKNRKQTLRSDLVDWIRLHNGG
jgi:hypothetical protein